MRRIPQPQAGPAQVWRSAVIMRRIGPELRELVGSLLQGTEQSGRTARLKILQGVTLEMLLRVTPVGFVCLPY